MSNDTPENARRCDVSGELTTGKLYILRTTDGPEEFVSTEALFHPGADTELGGLFLELAARVDRLEAEIEGKDAPENGDQEEAGKDGDRIQQAATAAAKPVKKAPAQRKASD